MGLSRSDLHVELSQFTVHPLSSSLEQGPYPSILGGLLLLDAEQRLAFQHLLFDPLLLIYANSQFIFSLPDLLPDPFQLFLRLAGLSEDLGKPPGGLFGLDFVAHQRSQASQQFFLRFGQDGRRQRGIQAEPCVGLLGHGWLGAKFVRTGWFGLIGRLDAEIGWIHVRGI
jgi:hypothetical protein